MDEDPRFAEECENGHYHCQLRCPIDGGCKDSCDHDSGDVEPSEGPVAA